MNHPLTEKEIDELVISEAENFDAWEQPIRVNRKPVFSLHLPQPPEVVTDREILNGEPVFRGTRVPVTALLENLKAGVSIDEFLERFPTVGRDQAVQVLEYFKDSIRRIKEAA